MANYSIPVVIGVDEDRIAKEIEKEVDERVTRAIVAKVEDIIYDKKGYHYRSREDDPLRQMVRAEVNKVITDEKDLILKEAAKLLAEKMYRSKAVKDAIAHTIKSVED